MNPLGTRFILLHTTTTLGLHTTQNAGRIEAPGKAYYIPALVVTAVVAALVVAITTATAATTSSSSTVTTAAAAAATSTSGRATGVALPHDTSDRDIISTAWVSPRNLIYWGSVLWVHGAAR